MCLVLSGTTRRPPALLITNKRIQVRIVLPLSFTRDAQPHDPTLSHVQTFLRFVCGHLSRDAGCTPCHPRLIFTCFRTPCVGHVNAKLRDREEICESQRVIGKAEAEIEASGDAAVQLTMHTSLGSSHFAQTSCCSRARRGPSFVTLVLTCSSESVRENGVLG